MNMAVTRTASEQRLQRGYRVLLVEDAPQLRWVFGKLLRMHGFEVKEANDGREALDSIGAFRPEIVVTDLMMPVMNGVELIDRLRADPRTATLPVLAMSADASNMAELSTRSADHLDCVAKPVDLPTLLYHLDHLLR